MDAAESPAARPPTTAEVYAWQADRFGRGIAQNYALVIVEEVTEAVDVLHDHEHGLSLRDVRVGLREELGDAMITLHSFAGFEGFELTPPDSPTAGGVWEIRDAMVRDAGKLARAVLKRAQGIRDREQTWTAQAQWAAQRLLRSACSLAMAFELDPAVVLGERWERVSTRDATGHRPAGDALTVDSLPPDPVDDERVEVRGDVSTGAVAEQRTGPGPWVTVGPQTMVRVTDASGQRQADVYWHADGAQVRLDGQGAFYVRPTPSRREPRDWRMEAAGLEAQRDAARSSLADVAEALGMVRPARADARAQTGIEIISRARLIFRQWEAQRADESRWGVELEELRNQLTDLRAAVRASTGCEPGEELRSVGARDVGLGQYVCDALATPSDDHADVRGIVSRAGRKIAELHGAVDGMRDQLCRAVGLPLISDDGPEARWARALELARKHWPDNAQARQDRDAVAELAAELGLAPYVEPSAVLTALRERLGRDDAEEAEEAEPEPERRAWRPGDRVVATVPLGRAGPFDTTTWPGIVAAVGPQPPAHGVLPFLPDGSVRVALDSPDDVVVPSGIVAPVPPVVRRGWQDFTAADVAAEWLTEREDDGG